MPNIFISYSRKSQDAAKNLAMDIQALGNIVWFDQDLSGGQAWWDKILSVIRDSDVFVFLLDPDGLNSTACQREFRYAAALDKPVLPVLVADGISTNLLPPELSRLHFIDYRNRDHRSALSLARALVGIPVSKGLPDPLPVPPEVPVSYMGGLTRKLETTSSLTYEEQTAFVVDLRRSLRDPKAADDARILLGKLRTRRDLFATIAEEIDELLGVSSPAKSAPQESARRETSAPMPPQKVAAPHRDATTPVPPSSPGRVSPLKGLLSVLVGAAVGSVLGGIAYLCSRYVGPPVGFWPGIQFAAGAGAIAGAITRTSRRVMLVALAGFAVGSSVWFATDGAVIAGGGVGAVVGATVGLLLKQWRRWP